MNTALNLLLITSLDLFKKGQWGTWTEVSDRVRGGVSYSSFSEGVFKGNLNSTLLSAGFAGQETPLNVFDTVVDKGGVHTIEVGEWNGLEVEARGDGKIYSIRLLDASSISGRAFKV